MLMNDYITLLSEASPALEDAGNGLGNVTDAVVTLSDILGKYGPFIGILAVFLVLFICTILYVFISNRKMVNNILKSNEIEKKENNDSNEKILNALLKKLDEQDKNSNDESDAKKDLMNIYIDVNIAFKDACRIVLGKLKCDRVAVYVFHNGNNSSHGLPFFKMSCVTEWTTRGSATSRGKSHTDLPLHLFTDFIERVYNDGAYAVSDVKQQCIIDESVSAFTEYSNVQSFFIKGINDNDGSLAGFSIVEFRETNEFTNPDVYARTEEALDTMNDNIKSIVIDHHNKYAH